MRYLLLFALLLAPQSKSKLTFISHEVLGDGTVVVDPIYTPRLELRPENTVARQIRPEEALSCTVSQQLKEAEIEMVPGAIKVLVLDCDGARFTITGIQFERSEPR